MNIRKLGEDIDSDVRFEDLDYGDLFITESNDPLMKLRTRDRSVSEVLNRVQCAGCINYGSIKFEVQDNYPNSASLKDGSLYYIDSDLKVTPIELIDVRNGALIYKRKGE
jgi:hypothetical protein